MGKVDTLQSKRISSNVSSKMLRAVLDSLVSTSNDDLPQPTEIDAIVVSDTQMSPVHH
jgi:hypothetical protein